MGKYRHIIWDWNGTLLDDAWLCVDVMNKLLKRRKMPELDLNRYQEAFGFPIIDYYKRLGFTFEEEPFEIPGTEFIVEYNKRWEETKLQQDALSTLEIIRNLNISQSILSAQEQQQLNRFMDHFNLSQYFENISGLYNHYADGKLVSGKKLIDSLYIPCDEVLLIGDTDHDFEVSETMGVDCVLVHRNHQLKSTLEKTGMQVFDSLDEIVNLVNM